MGLILYLSVPLAGIEALKQATRRYARKQNKWVRNRFLKRKRKSFTKANVSVLSESMQTASLP